MPSFPVRVILRALAGLHLLVLLAAPCARAQSASLDGDWRFAVDPAGKLVAADLANLAAPLPARVPGSWQSEFPGLRDYAGVAWYWRTFSVSPPTPGRAVLLHFGAVDYRAEVFVNGHKAGEHEGGYLPFDVDATPWVRPGANDLAVRVADPGADPSEVEGIRYAEIPHGKQNWYVQTSGLWQSVELEVRPATRIGTLHVRAGADGQFKIDLAIANPPGAPAGPGAGAPPAATPVGAGSPYAGAEIADPSGRVVWKDSATLAPGQERASFTARLAHPELWSPSSPALYTLRAWLYSGDTASSRFGFRTFEARDGRFYLNGQPIYLRGALDQDFYPDTAYTPPSLDYVEQEMQEAKALGLNLLRCHIKAPDPRYLEAADAAGMLIWYEIPNWDKLTPDSERRGAETLAAMVARDANHPSIVAVSLINESWGVDLKRAEDRSWLKNFAAEARRLVPGWLVDDNSSCCDNFHMSSDIADTHDYASIPDSADDFDRFVTDLASRPASLWSPEGDSEVSATAPLMLSEFGNWGLSVPPDPLPWWFDRSFGGREITLPGGLSDRFVQYAYDSVFPSLQALAEASQEHEYQSLKFEIESLRSRAAIQGYVITEFTDVNWESNGLLDMWRRPKAFGPRLAALQGGDFIGARIARRNFRSGERVHADLFFSHYGGQPVSGAALHWSVEGSQDSYIVPLPGAGPVFVMPAGAINFTAPPVPAPVKRTVNFSVEANGRVLAANSLDLYFYPPRAVDLPPAVAFDDPSGRLRRLAEAMRADGYLEPSGQEALPVTIASTLDAHVESVLAKGGRVILIASDPQTLAPGLKIAARARSNFDGNWISNFLWVRNNHAVFHGVGFSALPGFEAQAAAPPAVIEGLPAAAFPDVLAGEFYGWLHSNVGVLLQARAGPGKLLVTTFGFGAAYGTDPYATTLLDNLVQYAVTGFEPHFEMPLAAAGP